MKVEDLKIGMKVRYTDMNLRQTGVVRHIAPTVHGGDCKIEWDHGPYSLCPIGFKSEECSMNLTKLENQE
jgi:hypothetical protein